LYLTFIDLTTEGDAFFPEFEHLTLNEVAREAHQPDEKNKYSYEFVTYHVE
jgi:dihydrofolate reductase